ncbi:MAG TPA: hypothetical protein VLF79_01035 [Candidatus Saccharimonadales bacterium]|nr:hypothetical protein [Candidatus Saccharimonadales bacterium]
MNSTSENNAGEINPEMPEISSGFDRLNELQLYLSNRNNFPLPDSVLNRLLRYVSPWTMRRATQDEYYRPEEVRIFSRRFADEVEVDFPFPEDGPTVKRDVAGFRVDIRNVSAYDLRSIIEAERRIRQVEAQQSVELRDSQHEENTSVKRSSKGPNKTIYSAKNELREGSLFSEREVLILQNMSTGRTRVQTANLLFAQLQFVSKTVTKAAERFGVVSENPTDTLTDLMLIAVGSGAVELEDSVLRGKTGDLTSTDVDFLKKYFDPNPNLRNTFRQQLAESSASERWTNIMARLGLTGMSQSQLVVALYALNDGIIELPDELRTAFAKQNQDHGILSRARI